MAPFLRLGEMRCRESRDRGDMAQGVSVPVQGFPFPSRWGEQGVSVPSRWRQSSGRRGAGSLGSMETRCRESQFRRDGTMDQWGWGTMGMGSQCTGTPYGIRRTAGIHRYPPPRADVHRRYMVIEKVGRRISISSITID